jgi:hypothetical protein
LGVAIFTVAVVESRARRGFGHLGGYLWDSGPVRSIEARWRVPTVLGGSDGSEAFTWVGIQRAFGLAAPFVQVGTVESLDYGRRFGLGEWFEEDPTDLVRHMPEPYPKLSTVTFQKLRLNGRPPPYGPLFSQWLAVAGEPYLAPTPLAHDQFSMQPASVSRAGGNYLTDVAPFDAAYYAFLAQSERWTSRTATAPAAAQAAVFASAVHATDRLLGTQHWPSDVQSEVSQELDRNQSVITDLKMVSRLEPDQRPALRQRLLRDLHKGAEIGHLIRRALRIPEYIPRS